MKWGAAPMEYIRFFPVGVLIAVALDAAIVGLVFALVLIVGR